MWAYKSTLRVRTSRPIIISTFPLTFHHGCVKAGAGRTGNEARITYGYRLYQLYKICVYAVALAVQVLESLKHGKGSCSGWELRLKIYEYSSFDVASANEYSEGDSNLQAGL